MRLIDNVLTIRTRYENIVKASIELEWLINNDTHAYIACFDTCMLVVRNISLYVCVNTP